MALHILQTDSPDLNKVQVNVKEQLDGLESTLPSTLVPFVAVTADYTVMPNDAVVLANPLTSCSVTLPPAAMTKGWRFTVKNTSTAGTVHVRGRYSATAPELIDKLVRYDLAALAVARLYSDGAAWWVL
jgi:hypothetical protein